MPGKRVGYMPQEIALYGEFSIRETMMYFGWIFGMQTTEIRERLQFLLNFLDLPSETRLVKNLRYVCGGIPVQNDWLTNGRFFLVVASRDECRSPSP